MKNLSVAFSLLCLIVLSLGMGACKSTSSNSTVAAILTPLKALGCSVETAVAGDAANVLVTQCGAPLAMAQACIMGVIGNANLCSVTLPASVQSVRLLSGAAWKTIGDIPASALKSGTVTAQGVHVEGVIGNLACPLVTQFMLGYASGAIPVSCGCTTSLTQSAFAAAISAGCMSIVPVI